MSILWVKGGVARVRRNDVEAMGRWYDGGRWVGGREFEFEEVGKEYCGDKNEQETGGALRAKGVSAVGVQTSTAMVDAFHCVSRGGDAHRDGNGVM